MERSRRTSASDFLLHGVHGQMFQRMDADQIQNRGYAESEDEGKFVIGLHLIYIYYQK